MLWDNLSNGIETSHTALGDNMFLGDLNDHIHGELDNLTDTTWTNGERLACIKRIRECLDNACLERPDCDFKLNDKVYHLVDSVKTLSHALKHEKGVDTRKRDKKALDSDLKGITKCLKLSDKNLAYELLDW